MSRSNLLPPGEVYTLDEMLAAVRYFAVHEQKTGRRGTRHVYFSLDDHMRITSVQGVDKPPQPKRLPKGA